MNYALKIQHEAVIDIQEAFEWYEMQQTGLGLEFIEEIENGFANICEHPKYYISINKVFRRIKIKRFPYLIVYEIEKNTIIIISVRHGSRKSKL